MILDRFSRYLDFDPRVPVYSVMPVDPHPAWDLTWRCVTFNAFVDGTRRVTTADMEELVS